MHERSDASPGEELFADLRVAIGRRVEELRDERGLTQADAAEGAGLSQGHWSKIERGELDIRLSTLLRVQHALGLDFFESLFGVGPSTRRLKGEWDEYGSPDP